MTAWLTGWDWFVLAVLVLSVGVGLARGLVRSVFALAAWVTAFLGAPLVATLAIDALGLQSAGPWTFVAAFVAVFAVVRVAGGLLSGGLRRAGLGSVDRALGGVLGLARALVLVAVAVVGASALGWNREPAWTQALVRPLLEGMLVRIEPLLPERMSGIRRT